jgi:toxin-antitoxin system PIN domain toxin
VILPDVNVLVYAFRQDAPRHSGYRSWLERLVDGDEAYALSDLVLSGFVRVVTHPRLPVEPDPIEDALDFAQALRVRPNCLAISPGRRHWSIFNRLCRAAGARGNLVPDAYLAALAIESGAELASADRGFARFADLRWRHPLEAS